MVKALSVLSPIPEATAEENMHTTLTGGGLSVVFTLLIHGKPTIEWV
jgi:hypothetical protein